MPALQALQTAEEQASGTTTESNGVGFNNYDAELMWRLAHNLELAHAKKVGDRLQPYQYAQLARRLPKYAKQVQRLIQSQARSR
mgnify:FL=1